MRLFLYLALATVITLAGLLSWFFTAQQPPYRLAVVLVVDQMRPDYVARFGPDFTGGLRRLLDGGALFTAVYHDHAVTETAVGHATLGTGMVPAHHGIIANGWYDKRLGRDVYACEDSTVTIIGHTGMGGRSPRLLAMPAVGDWLKKRSPASRVLAVSLKDRAAINMGGHYPDGVYWYNRNDGQFITSTFYMDTTPAWVDSFNMSGAANRYFVDGWQANEPEGSFNHPFDTTGRGMRGYYRDLYGTPFGDYLLLDFACAASEHMELGEDDVPDILIISCSAGDVLGHVYGPDSPEMHNYYRHLDKELAGLFDRLDTAVGRERYFVVLASDHGVMPTPEVLRSRGIDARRIPPRLVDSTVDATLAAVADEYNVDIEMLKAIRDGVIIDSVSAMAAGVDFRRLEAAAAAALRKAPFLVDVYTVSDLVDPATPDRPYLRQYRNNLFPGRGCDLWFRYPDFCLLSDDTTGTSHGSVYRDDTHVPAIVWAPGYRNGVIGDSVRTVDIAPTVLELLGYEPPESLDGQSLLSRLVR